MHLAGACAVLAACVGRPPARRSRVAAGAASRAIRAVERACAYHKELVDVLTAHILTIVHKCAACPLLARCPAGPALCQASDGSCLSTMCTGRQRVIQVRTMGSTAPHMRIALLLHAQACSCTWDGTCKVGAMSHRARVCWRAAREGPSAAWRSRCCAGARRRGCSGRGCCRACARGCQSCWAAWTRACAPPRSRCWPRCCRTWPALTQVGRAGTAGPPHAAWSPAVVQAPCAGPHTGQHLLAFACWTGAVQAVTGTALT
jgi:hypothetical protein